MVLIAHATVPGPDDNDAFAHAVAIAARARGRLLSIHAHAEPAIVDTIPHAARLLESWGREPNAVEHDRVVVEPGGDPMRAVLAAAGHAGADLLVAATHPRGMLHHALMRSGAEFLASGSRAPTLFVPVGGRSLVAKDGGLALRTIVVPIGDEEAARVGVERSGWFVDLVGADQVTVELVYVGKEGSEPVLPALDHPRITFVQLTHPGRVAQVLAEIGHHADLVLMPSYGPDSLSDSILGTKTEQVKRRIDRPLLSVPMRRR